jgi:hypothetical protein
MVDQQLKQDRLSIVSRWAFEPDSFRVSVWSLEINGVAWVGAAAVSLDGESGVSAIVKTFSALSVRLAVRAISLSSSSIACSRMDPADGTAVPALGFMGVSPCGGMHLGILPK